MGCATSLPPGALTEDSPPEVKKEVVAVRANARWDALIKGDLDEAYGYLSPASRATMPLAVYRTHHKVGIYRAATIDSVDCEAAVCTVNLHVTFTYKRAKGVDMPLVEKWLISEGKAWLVESG